MNPTFEVSYEDKPDEVWLAVLLPNGRFALSPCNPEAVSTTTLNQISEDLSNYLLSISI